MTFQLNGKTLELDLFDIDVAEKMEKAILDSAHKMMHLDEVPKQTLFTMMRKGCNIVFEFFDNVWGEGTAKELFDNKMNYKICLETYACCTKQYKKYMTEDMPEEMKQFVSEMEE